MKIWKVIVAVMVIFGAGVITGGMLVRIRVSAPTEAPVAGQPMAMPAMAAANGVPAAALPPARQQFLQRLNRQLTLTPEQSAGAERILRESQGRLSKIWEPMAPQAREETRKARAQIQALLTPEQKRTFDEVFKPRRPLDPDRRLRRPRLEGEVAADRNDAKVRE